MEAFGYMICGTYDSCKERKNFGSQSWKRYLRIQLLVNKATAELPNLTVMVVRIYLCLTWSDPILLAFSTKESCCISSSVVVAVFRQTSRISSYEAQMPSFVCRISFTSFWGKNIFLLSKCPLNECSTFISVSEKGRLVYTLTIRVKMEWPYKILANVYFVSFL